MLAEALLSPPWGMSVRISKVIALLIALAALGVCATTAAADGEEGRPPAESPRPANGLTLQQVRLWHGRHPRLLFTSADLPRLRARRATEPYHRIWETLLWRADRHLLIDPADVGRTEYRGRDQMPHILERLALVGLLTGERKYSRKAVVLMTALGEQGFPFHGRGVDGAGDLAIGLALAYDWAYDFLTAEEHRALRRQLDALGTELSTLMSPDGGTYGKLASRRGAAGHHAVALAGGGLGLMSLALRGEANRNSTNAWQATADRCIRNYYRDALGSDGAGIEGFDLTMYGLHAALPYTIARRRMDKVDLGDGTALGSVASWYVYELLPGPEMLPIGESGDGLGAEDTLAAMFAACGGNPLHAWFYDASHGGSGCKTFGTASESLGSGDVMSYLWYSAAGKIENPSKHLPLGKQFPSRGVSFVRSGWGDPAGDVVVSFHCPSRAHMGRWQMDVNQFTLYAYRVGWAIDSGYAWREAGGEPSLTLSGSSQAHNLFQIDGHDAIRPYGRTLAFVDDKDWSLAVGEGSVAMDVKTFRRYLAVGKREGKARYLIIVDEIEPKEGGQHRYRHFLHTARGNKVEASGRVARITTTDGATGQYAVISPRGATLKVANFPTHRSGLHPRIESVHRTEGKFFHVAVLVPRAKGDQRPIVIRPVADAEGAIAFRVTVDGIVDRVCVLMRDGAKPPKGFGTAGHKLQLTNGAFKQSLLFDLEEPGHDKPDANDAGPSKEE